MEGTEGDGERPLDFSKTFRGRIVNRTDPQGEGRVGVFIPNLITEQPNSAQVPTPKDNVLPGDVFDNQHELAVAGSVRTDNYIWVRPGGNLVEGGDGGRTTSGSYRVPKMGTMITVEFEDRDPSKPFYRAASPSVSGDVVGGDHVGAGTNMQNSAANWKDPAKKPDIHIIAQYDNGTVIYYDGNANANAFVIRMANGHTLSVGDAAESGIVLQTAKGHLLQLDENSGEIRVRTQTGNASLTLKDNGDVTGKNAGKLFWDSEGDQTFRSGGAVLFQASASFTVEAASASFQLGTGAFAVTGGSTDIETSSNTAVPPFEPDPD
jgi:hypothetical protein